tara:strand:+ start:301 stop:543 length:243 start_codon:yes stop_codon:yes gene_type:complete
MESIVLYPYFNLSFSCASAGVVVRSIPARLDLKTFFQLINFLTMGLLQIGLKMMFNVVGVIVALTYPVMTKLIYCTTMVI